VEPPETVAYTVQDNWHRGVFVVDGFSQKWKQIFDF
jgi:hypothetical protein